MSAYYNENDPKAAAWLRELIRCGHIASGVVDERSIVEVQPDDLRGFTQCHFFAGIGGWSYALRLAGWPDDRPVWTGSCPCQPFSAAGKGDEFADERHLWPAWFRLARELRPDAIFGEQVSSKDALAWFDHIRVDLEGEGYALGVLDTCAAGVGAPHIRQRLYFVADSGSERRQQVCRSALGDEAAHGRTGRIELESHGDNVAASLCPTCELADAGGEGQRPRNRRRSWGSDEYWRDVERCSGMGDAIKPGLEIERGDGRVPRETHGGNEGQTAIGTSPSACNGFWRNAEWIPCRDGKARPTEPGSFPLVTGAPARVVRLRGYGNAINARQAKEFIEAYREVIE